MPQPSIRKAIPNLIFALTVFVPGSGFAASYSVGGTLSGLGTGKNVTLLNNGGNALTRTANGAFVFSTKIASGASYKVTVGTQPRGQRCAITNATARVGTANVKNVSVKCVNSYSVGGTLLGLGSGKSVTLLNNGANALTRTSNGSFVFSVRIVKGGSFNVTIGTQPTAQTCRVTKGVGSNISADVSNVTVACGPAAKYKVTDIGGLGGVATWGADINEFGDIAGSAQTIDGTKHAFLYTSGAMIDLGTMGGTSSDAFGINDRGQVVGAVYGRGACYSEMFVYQSGIMRRPVDRPCDEHSRGTNARAINNAGWIAGNLLTAEDDASVLIVSGAIEWLQWESHSVDINAAGQVTVVDHDPSGIGNGSFIISRDFQWSGVTSLGNFAYYSGINDSGQITGSFGYVKGGPLHAFFGSLGVMKDLGTLGGSASYGVDINNLGQIVGASRISGDGATHAFVYSKATGMLDLNKLSPAVDSAGTYLVKGRAVNEAGMIVVNASNKRTYLLVPVSAL